MTEGNRTFACPCWHKHRGQTGNMYMIDIGNGNEFRGGT